MGIFLTIAPVIVLAILLAAAHALDSKRSFNRETNFYSSDRESKNLSPVEAHVIKDIEISMVYEGEERYIDGVPIKTPDQLKEWWILKGLTENIAAHLQVLENDMYLGNCDNYAKSKEEWMIFYKRLRELCIRHRLWNPVLNDRQRFVPTVSQSFAETKVYRQIDESCEIGIDTAYHHHIAKEAIRNYIHSADGHVVHRRTMVNHLCGSDAEMKKVYRRLCDKMVADGILTESHDEKGRLLLKIRRRRKSNPINNEPSAGVPMTPSKFDPSLYSNISNAMLAKVRHTVGEPLNVDRQNNCCEFISLSTGTRYYTSLTSCSCPAFSHSEACKHMVALAKHLWYIKS